MNDPRFPPVGFIAELTPWGHPQYIPGQSAQQRPPGAVMDPADATRGGFSPSGLPLSNVNSFPMLDNTPGGGVGPATAAPSTPTAPSILPTQPVRDPHHYAQMISLNFAIATTSAKIIDQPPSKRNLLMLRNTSATANIYVEFAKDATVANTVLRITPNTVILFDVVVPQDDIYAIADAASATLSVSFSTIAG